MKEGHNDTLIWRPTKKMWHHRTRPYTPTKCTTKYSTNLEETENKDNKIVEITGFKLRKYRRKTRIGLIRLMGPLARGNTSRWATITDRGGTFNEGRLIDIAYREWPEAEHNRLLVQRTDHQVRSGGTSVGISGQWSVLHNSSFTCSLSMVHWSGRTRRNNCEGMEPIVREIAIIALWRISHVRYGRLWCSTGSAEIWQK